jgi:CBS domain containing-hemolysin-like protein
MSIRDCIRGAKKIFCRCFNRKQETTLRDAIEELIEEDCSNHQNGGESSINDDEREILGNVLGLRDIQIKNVMIPRIEIKALPVTTQIDEVISEFVENQISSTLIYQGTIDNVLGVLYLKDVANWFKVNKPFNINVFLKDVLFVPSTMRTLSLLLKMKETGIKIAVVVDEYGGVEGLVSFSDLVEEIIGDIQDVDEPKKQKKKIYKEEDNVFIADAQTQLADVFKYTGIKLISADNSIDTIGGYIVLISGKIPVRGELIPWPKQNIEFEILDANPRRIRSIRIRRK